MRGTRLATRCRDGITQRDDRPPVEDTTDSGLCRCVVAWARPTLVAMTSRNLALIAARTSLGMTQQEFAREIRKVGDVMGDPNECDARDVQRWEAGQVKSPVATICAQ